VLLASDYPFLDVFWTILLVFLWIAWLFLFVSVLVDVFRRDISGWKKAGWTVFALVAPFLGVLVYLILNGHGMTRRELGHMQETQAQYDEYVRQSAGGGGTAGEIARAKELLDSGAITQAEFDQIKQKALG
jgi:hypothetical protein